MPSYRLDCPAVHVDRCGASSHDAATYPAWSRQALTPLLLEEIPERLTELAYLIGLRRRGLGNPFLPALGRTGFAAHGQGDTAAIQIHVQYAHLYLLPELDQPGEWYLDRDSGLLYFWPPSPLTDGDDGDHDFPIRQR